MSRFAVLTFVGLSLSLMCPPALAQYDNRALFDRIERLERDLQATQRLISRSGVSTTVTSPALGGGVRSSDDRPAPPSQDTVERLNDRVYQLEKALQGVTGQLENANFKAEQATQKLEHLQKDIDLRFQDLRQGGGLAGGVIAGGAVATTTHSNNSFTTPNSAETSITSIANLTDPKAQYDAAYAAAQRGDFSTAERSFKTFLEKNPDHSLAGNAEYWLSDISYTRKDYATAAAGFATAYKKYPKHSKSPDMLYKLGASFGHMGKKTEACKALNILFKQHTDMPERVKRAATSEKKRYNCK